MGTISRLVQRLMGNGRTTSDLGAALSRLGPEPSVAEISDVVCELARAAAPLDAALAEEEIPKYVAGLVNARSHSEALRVSEDAFRELAKAALTEEQQAVFEDLANELISEAAEAEQSDDLRRSREREAEAEVDEQREAIGELPLVEKVKTHWALALVAMTATSAGVGTLARLSLESVSDSAARFLVTLAAVGGTFASELVLGTLGAETYDRTPDSRRRRILFVVLGGLILALVGTEILAAIARQSAVDLTNGFSIDLSTGQPKPGSGALTPSLYWTAPLALLATVAGSGVVGIARLRETSKPAHDGLAVARARLDDARAATRQSEAKVKELRGQASTSRERAAHLRGEATAARASSEHLVAALDRHASRHAELLGAVTARAILEYRIAAANLARSGADAPPLRRHSRIGELRAAFGVAGLSGAAATLASASVGIGAAVASVVFLLFGTGRIS